MKKHVVSYTLPYKRWGTVYQDLYFYNFFVGSVATDCEELKWNTPIWCPESVLADGLKKIKEADVDNDAARLMHYYAGALKRYVLGDGDGSKIKVIDSWPKYDCKLWQSDYYHSKSLGGDTFDYRYPDADGILLGRLVKTETKTRFMCVPTRISSKLGRLFDKHKRMGRRPSETLERAFSELVSPRLFF